MKLKKKKKFKGQDHGLAYMNREEMKAMNAMKDSPGFIGRMARVGEQMPMNKRDGYPSFEPDFDEAENYGTLASPGLDNPVHNQSSGGGDGGNGGGQSAPQMTRQQAMEQFGLMESVDLDAMKKTAGNEALQGQRDSARQARVNEFENYKTRMRGMEDDYDLSGERSAVQGLAGTAGDVGSRFDERMGGLAGQYSGMAGYESDIAGMRQGVGDLAKESLDRESLMKDRGFYSGLAESARKGQQRGAEEQLMRGMSGAGSSPEQIALAKAKLQSSGEAARRDSLGAAQAAMGARQQQLSQGAGLMGQQAGLLGQQAGLTGQAQGLGMNRLGAVGQTYGNMANMGLGVLGQQAGFQGQSAGLLTQQMQGLGQLMQGQVGMTDAQLGDIRERDNMAFQERMADKNAEAQIAAAEAQKSGGGGGGCCWIMLEARYGNGTMDLVVRKYRDEHMTDKNKRGYYKFAEFIIPLMRKYKAVQKLVQWTFGDTLVAYGRWHYGLNKWGWIFSPIKSFWMGLFNAVGKETEFIRENGEVV